jgi:alpha-L-fucosidase
MHLQGTPEFKHEIATCGPQTTFGYKDFIPMSRTSRVTP